MAPQQPSADRFVAAQPRIPGVPDAPSAAPEPTPQAAKPHFAPFNLLSQKWLFTAICAVLVVGVVGAFILMARRSHSAALDAVAAAKMPPVDVIPEVALPTAPGEIATTTEISKPWSSKKFVFANPLSHAVDPAMLVHLPGGSYWAFSLRAPFGGCTLEYVTDTKRIDTEYSFHTNHPMVVDPCSRSVFDLASYNQGDTGIVRGAVVHGPAFRPPIAIQVKVKGQHIEALRME
jgi:hypothetical protein